MQGPRCVFDTNVIVSALLSNLTAPHQAIIKAENAGIVLFSEALLLELTSVLARPKFAAYLSTGAIDRLLERIQSAWLPVPIMYEVQACSDPDDDKFLDIAVNGAATHLITGDRALLRSRHSAPRESCPPLSFSKNSQADRDLLDFFGPVSA